jgi:putative ABC transport system permease protein
MVDRDTWQEIFATIKKNKLRTALTALGVFWGIFMLVFLMGIGDGLETGVFRNFGSRTSNIMYVWSQRSSLPYKGFKAGRYNPLVLEDAQYVKDNIANVKAVVPSKTMEESITVYKSNSGNYEIRGEFPETMLVEPLKLFEGRYINTKDIEGSRKIAILGKTVKDELFGDLSPIGEHIVIKGIDFVVAGVFGPEEIKEWTQDDMESIVIPLPTMRTAFGLDLYLENFIVAAEDDVKIGDIEEEVRDVLKQRKDIHPDDPSGIGGFNLQEEFQQVKNLFFGINAFLWFVGIGTLLAGIVGVSNIMLIIVKERTKEIGVRKALGASPSSIVKMILTESVFITAMAGYLGLVSGILVIWGLNYLMISLNIENENFYNPKVNVYIAIGALVLLVIAGSIAGLIPAIQASKVNPVDALKDE